MKEGGEDRDKKKKTRQKEQSEGEAGHKDRQKGVEVGVRWGWNFLKGHILYCKE